MTLEKLRVLIDMETRPYREALAKVKNETKSATNEITAQTSKIKSVFSSVAKFIAGLAIGRMIIGFGKSAITLASDLQEVQNVVDTAFGSMKSNCEEFAKTAITQFGMSELSAKRTASMYMAMSNGVGIAKETASQMALTITGLTGDMASFFNVSQSVADTALQSIWTGETESLKKFGVVMTEVNLKQFAFANGLNADINSMSQAELIGLRYKFAIDKLSLANGDFTKTSATWANQVRVLQEQWKEFMTIMGNGLIAVLTPVVQMLNQFIAKLVQMAQTASSVIGTIFGKQPKKNSAAAIITSDTMDATAAQDGLGNSLDKTSQKAKKTAKDMRSIGGFDELNIIQPKSDSDSGTSSGTGSIATTPIDSGSNEEQDTSGIKNTIDKVMGYYTEFIEFLKKNKVVISSLLAGMFTGFVAFEIVKHFDSIIKIIAKLLSPLIKLIGTFKTFFVAMANGKGFITALSLALGPITATALIVATAVGAITAALVYLWQTSEQFRTIVIDAISALMSVLTNLYENVIKPLFAFLANIFVTVLIPIANFLSDVFVTAVDFVMSILLTFWTNVLAPIANYLVDVLAIALQGVIDVWEAWKPAIEVIYACIQWIWDNILKPIVEFIKDKFIKIFENFGEVIDKLIPSLKEIFQGFIDFLVGVFSLDIEKVVSGVMQMFQGVNNFLGGVFTTDWTNYFGGFGNVLNGFFTTVGDIWNSIKRIFSGVIEFIKGAFSGDWERAWNGISDIFGGIFDGLGALLKAPFNVIIGMINWVIDKINGVAIDVPKWVPGIGGSHFGLDIGKLEYLAKGGVVDRPTLSVVGEAGKEAVIPLENNTGWITLLASQLNSFGGDDSKFDKMISLLAQLIQAVDNKDLSIGDRDIGEANNRYNNRKGFSFGSI